MHESRGAGATCESSAAAEDGRQSGGGAETGGCFEKVDEYIDRASRELAAEGCGEESRREDGRDTERRAEGASGDTPDQTTENEGNKNGK